MIFHFLSSYILQNKVQNYSAIAQRINANFIHDEGSYFQCASDGLVTYIFQIENPLIENNEEQVLASEIEHDLGEVVILLSKHCVHAFTPLSFSCTTV